MKNHVSIQEPVIVLVGPTAVGKTALSFDLVESFHCEIVSMDSMQVYRHMDIGTAKPSPQELEKVFHHLINIRNPDEQYNAAQFIQDAVIAAKKIISCGKTPLITGGTGLYLTSIIKGLFDEIKVNTEIRKRVATRFKQEGREQLYQELAQLDPVSADRIHPHDTQRLLRALEIYYSTGISWSKHLADQNIRAGQTPYFSHLIQVGLNCDREKLCQRIEKRSNLMLDQGLAEEVTKLLEMGYDKSLPSMQSIGYRHALKLLDQSWNKSQMIDELVKDTRRYAKRQMTWFNKNKEIQWFAREDNRSVLEYIKKEFNRLENCY